MSSPSAKTLRLNSTEVQTGSNLPLPGFLRTTTRAGVTEIDPLLAGITVEKVYGLAMPTRGGPPGEARLLEPKTPELLALETEDGTTLFIRSDALAEAVERVRPEAIVNGEVDLGRFRDPNATARGLGDVLWKVATVLRLPSDGVVDQAKEQALQWAKEKLGEQVEAKAYELGSFLGAKALMWKIESRLAGRPGLYHWHNKILDPSDRCLPGDPRLKAAAEGKPMLVLIHGTASYTLGSYADLREDEATWSQLMQHFPGGIFGYEHRTFSESPAENAEALLEVLPKGARVSVVTHSRGGLVGDLLCLGQVTAQAIDAYRIDTSGSDDPEGLEREAQEERQRLRAIGDRLAINDVVVERYVRVACPARGTRILSENLDAALSDFLNLLQWGGGALVGVVASALGGPVAGETFGKGASSCLGVVKRLVLEIAGRRIDPRMVPGIAAMRTDSPLARFLAHPDTHRRDGLQMAVIAGDTEFDGLGLSNLGRRVANLFCDWRLFDRNDNDLVVDTDSMYAGLGFRPGARYLYDQDSTVTHFRYFRNPVTRDALRAWLTADEVATAGQFLPLTGAGKVSWRDREARQVGRGVPAGPRPVAIVIPGIMGSHIEVDRKRSNEPGSGNRIWFDPASLAFGKLDSIRDPNSNRVMVEDLFEMFYGDLADHLADTHAVIRCPYDWRQPLEKCAAELKAKIEQAARDYPGQPIRLLAHSMGGLVARMLVQAYPDAWKKVLDSGGRLVMLGTPNNGSHLMVHTLLGKSGSMRKLEMMDAVHGLDEIVNIVAGFPGALALLPRSGFVDAGQGPGVIDAGEYYQRARWQSLKAKNTDRWYGNGIGGVPDQALLDTVRQSWQSLPRTIANPERVAYVFGQSDKTPCGVQVDPAGRLKLLFTPDGDGSVTWASGRLDNVDPDTRCWYMPVEHADLTGEEDYFPAIVELMEKGTTDKLNRLPRRRGEEAASFTLEAEPPVVPSDEELARAFLGSGPRRRKVSRGKQVLRVEVKAGDLRFLDQPVMCGHYVGDPVSGAEAALDDLLGGVLCERERLGVYAGEVGTSAIVLRPPNREERERGSLPGAIVVGLGQFTGQLGARQVSETVRAAVVRYLLQLRDAIGIAPEARVQLNSLLIGWSSTASISVAESVTAITRGVLEANRQFRDTVGKGREREIAVTDLRFIELFRDAAISAAHAVLDLPERLANDLKCLGARIEPAASLREGEGVVERLNAASDVGHWSRLIVTDADAEESACPPECYELRYKSPVPREVLRRLCEEARCHDQSGTAAFDAGMAEKGPEAAKLVDASPMESRYYPERLKYIFLSQRARAEAVVQQRQPGLVEAIIRDQRRNPAYDAKLGHTLFQLMVPLDYKAAAREQSRLLLVLDGYTANLPWELLEADGEALVLRTPMVRQLTTSRYRATVRTASRNAACIIANPSTAGFDKRFPGGKDRLDDLAGAEREGTAIAESLRNAGWSDIVLTPPGREAIDVFNTLYERPYRVLMIAAHGIFEAKARDGRAYSGVVLSDGLLITAMEVSQMEVVPEVVFLSCCHLGSISNPYSQPNRLAYSLSRELVEMGVRCVVAAGWAVNDEAACTFASRFFDRLTQGDTFGEAIFAARKAAYQQHPGSNTWGAYQAYGDPGYRLRPKGEDGGEGKSRPYVAVEELLAALRTRSIHSKRSGSQARAHTLAEQRQWVQRQLARCPPEWADRPDVAQAIGELYREYGAEGFDEARQAYLRALRQVDETGRVAIDTIEQLANMEARQGGKLADKGEVEKGLDLIDCGIRRIKALVDCVDGEGARYWNPERAGVLGSAFKLKASALVRRDKPSWTDVSGTLADAANAYRLGVREDPAATPYNTLNWLPLAWLAGILDMEADRAAELALRCGREADRRFGIGKDFWDAVMSVDAEMTAWLLGQAIEKPAETLRRHYDESVESLPRSLREWDSVVKQWRLLARFLGLRGQDGDAERAEVLEQLASAYGPEAGASASGAGEAAAEDRAGATSPNPAGETPEHKPRPSHKKKSG